MKRACQSALESKHSAGFLPCIGKPSHSPALAYQRNSPMENDDITLRSRPSKFEIPIILAVSALVFILIMVRPVADHFSVVEGVLGGIIAALIVGWLVQRRRSILRIERNGIFLMRSLDSPLYISWQEIDSIGVATVCHIEGGLYQAGFTQHVGIRLLDSSRLAASKRCADNRRLSEYDVLLTAAYGMPVDRFAAFLDERKEQFTKSLPSK